MPRMEVMDDGIWVGKEKGHESNQQVWAGGWCRYVDLDMGA